MLIGRAGVLALHSKIFLITSLEKIRAKVRGNPFCGPVRFRVAPI